MENDYTVENNWSLFLGDLSCFCQEIDLIRVFQQFGEIEDVQVKRNGKGRGLCYGFVMFVNISSAEAALAADGVVILGRSVKVCLAKTRFGSGQKGKKIPKSTGVKTPITADSVTSAQLHFSFISKQHVHLITEATVREVFSNFGEVKDVTIKKTSTNPVTGDQSGYGFVHYALTDSGIRAAIKASKIVRQVHINQVLYDSRVTWSLEEIMARTSDSHHTPPSLIQNEFSPTSFIPTLQHRSFDSSQVKYEDNPFHSSSNNVRAFSIRTIQETPPPIYISDIRSIRSSRPPRTRIHYFTPTEHHFSNY